MANPYAASIGELIRRQREVAELNMKQLAEMVGISNPYLSQIERGLRAPSDRVLHAIAESLQTTAEALNDEAGRHPETESKNPTLAAIRTDRRLSVEQRRTLETIYLAFLERDG